MPFAIFVHENLITINMDVASLIVCGRIDLQHVDGKTKRLVYSPVFQIIIWSAVIQWGIFSIYCLRESIDSDVFLLWSRIINAKCYYVHL